MSFRALAVLSTFVKFHVVVCFATPAELQVSSMAVPVKSSTSESTCSGDAVGHGLACDVQDWLGKRWSATVIHAKQANKRETWDAFDSPCNLLLLRRHPYHRNFNLGF